MATPLPTRPRSRLRSTVVTIVAAVAVLVLAEVGARALEPYLPAPDVWADDATAVKVAQMDRIGDSRGCVDVVFAGSSMARDALDPGQFTAADPHGRSAYNSALDASSPELLRLWLDDQVVSRVQPELVVIGLASFDLNDNASITASALRAYRRAPYSASGLVNSLERWTTAHLALVRQRPGLRDPGALGDAVAALRRGERTDRPDPDGIPDVIAADGHGLSRRDLTYRPGSGVEAFVRRELLNDFDLGGRQRSELERLVTDLQRRGLDVALVAMPVTPEYVDLHPDGRADQDAFLAAIEAVSADTGAALLEAPVLPPDAFADTHHLNARGADSLSGSLPQMLEEAGLGPRRC